MNDLCADIGYKSINHFGEELCGDHVDVVEENENSTVIVLADGLGSGVKASILSTLTSKIISTMMAEGLPVEECVSTIAATLPVCSVRGVAYSTFTIIHLKNNDIAEIIQYDNPHVIIIRDDVNYDYPKTEMNIGGKKIFRSLVKLQENDIFVAMSDGCPHAGIGRLYNFGWKREDIIDFKLDLMCNDYKNELTTLSLENYLYHHFSFIQKNADYFITLYQNGLSSLANVKFSALLPYTMPVWSDDPIEQEYRSAYIIAGIEAIQRVWITRGCIERIEEVVEIALRAQEKQIPVKKVSL